MLREFPPSNRSDSWMLMPRFRALFARSRSWFYRGLDNAMRCLHVACDLILTFGSYNNRSLRISIGSDSHVLRNLWCRFSRKVVTKYTPGNFLGSRVRIQKQCRSCRKVTVCGEQVDCDIVRLSIGKQPCNGRQVDPVGLEVECLHAGNGLPQKRIDATGVDPGIDRCHPCRLPVDAHFGFAKTSAAAALQGRCEIVGHTQIPELVIGSAPCCWNPPAA